MRSLSQIAAVTLYVAAVNAFGQFVVYPGVTDAGVALAWQAGLSLLSALPVVLISPQTVKLFRLSRRQAAGGAAIVAVAVAILLVLQKPLTPPMLGHLLGQLVTAPAEELIFRGFVWERTLSGGRSTFAAVGVNVVAFVAVHVPAVAVQGASPVALLIVAIVGVVLCCVRAVSGNLTLPTILHVAINVVAR